MGNKNMVEQKIELLIENIGKPVFLKLVDFMIKVLESPYEIKIFMVRRFYDLYMALEDIIEYLYEDKQLQVKGMIITNLSAVLLENDLKGKKILIVDDIMLHGRALREAGVYLTDHGVDLADIDLWVFLRNEESISINSPILDKVYVEKKVDANKWRNLSNEIINIFYITGQPYVSYLPYYEIQFGTKAADCILNFVKEKKISDISSDTLRYYNVSSYLHFMDLGVGVAEQTMIRIYVYEALSKIIIVPYAFLKPLDSDQIANLYKSMWKHMDMRCDKDDISLEFLTDSAQLAESKEKGRYAYGLLTYVISLSIGKLFLRNRQLGDCGWCKKVEHDALNVDIEDSAFHLEELMDVFKLSSQTEYNYFDSQNAEYELSGDISSIMDCLENKNYGAGSTDDGIERFISDYIKLSDRRDEELVRENKDRVRGIEIMRLAKYMNISDQHSIWAKVIKLVDSGRGTLSIIKNRINSRRYMDSLLYAGEQNFNCNEENMKYYIYPLLQYEIFCSKKTKSAQQAQPGKRILADMISEKNPQLREKVSDYEIEQLVNQNILDGYKDYYLKKYDMYDQDQQLKEVMKLEFDYQHQQV